ncbi:MAG: radical SAM family RiPP maturation amino acid epimerase [Pseudomonadota bacterium]
MASRSRHDALRGSPRSQIAHVKRFYERFVSDPKFRSALSDASPAGPSEHAREITRQYGIEIDPWAIAPLWSAGLKTSFETAELEGFPALKRWKDYSGLQLDALRSRREFDHADWASSCFAQWRQRQINRVESELGTAGGIANRFPVIAMELSDGCSVGCWFCGVSASRYAGSFPYTQHNAGMWRQVLATVVEQIGKPAREGFCYWASDPLDNPDYERFASDYLDIVGALPPITTAVPLRDVSRTRDLLAWRKRAGSGHDRFSILTVKILDRVHKEFTAEELIDVECVPQTRGSLLVKTQTGKLYGHENTAGSQPGSHATDKPRTIACVAGFLVNMVKGEVRLVSPCRARDEWPDGYIVHRQGRFETAEDFSHVIRSMIDQVMDVSLIPRSVVRLRADLRMEMLPQGVQLRSPGTLHKLGRSRDVAMLAHELARGPQRHQDIMASVMKAGANCFAVSRTIQDLFERGLLSDHPDDINGVGSFA